MSGTFEAERRPDAPYRRVNSPDRFNFGRRHASRIPPSNTTLKPQAGTLGTKVGRDKRSSDGARAYLYHASVEVYDDSEEDDDDEKGWSNRGIVEEE
jgi:hypothetical protein